MQTLAAPDAPESLASRLAACRLCPRGCGVNRRQSARGFCRADDSLAIASITIHHGEEPVLGGGQGLCNVFFRHCNLACRYCQNHQIAENNSPLGPSQTLAEVTANIAAILAQGIDTLGFVSPSHMLPQMLAIIQALGKVGLKPTIVYNSNGYDRVDNLRALENIVDIYLPDCKYMDAALAGRWSGAADYPQVVMAALKEMYRQKGNILHLDRRGVARRGMIVRHLVLPGALKNTVAALDFIAHALSPKLHLSLMSQYRPTPQVADDPQLGRGVSIAEYRLATETMERFGFQHGWAQEPDSANWYNPDFTRKNPFSD
ncbi:MAG: 4Fe-4S cluster-binding domain-containing protein [Desulfobulbaceae bacterium]|jgi:putative pyruvate formate lyase activating enzyme|nr:4Fe-4S cluster-binding domain-containing protein [Desulfobulbaceae bacterium]